jgi:hypothetical protein
MSQPVSTTIAVMGIDIGKNSFHIVGLDQRGAIVLRQRGSRSQVERRLTNMPPCLVGMEACVGAHHLSLQAQSSWSQCSADAGPVRSPAMPEPRPLCPPIATIKRTYRQVGSVPKREERHRSKSSPTSCRKRPSTPSYSITSSAMASTAGGIVRPSALAAFRLITRSNLVGRTTGRSPGLAPLRMRLT